MKINNHASIIDSTPLVIYNGCNPSRVVLRYDADQCQPYIVHMENMILLSDGNTWEHQDFYNGVYFADLESAEVEFQRRKK
jgi:hypothetical protein